MAQFCKHYLALAKQFRVSGKALPWYRKHVESLIHSHPERRLRDWSATDVTEWLEQLARDPGLTDWRFSQHIDSVRLLFGQMLRMPWSAHFDWNHWLTDGRRLEMSHPTLARSYEALEQARAERY